MDKYRVRLVLITPMLGTVPKSKEIYTDWVANHDAVTDEAVAEELETVETIEEKGWTGFHMDNGTPILYDYLIKGFLKSACYQMRTVKGSLSSKLTAYKKRIDGLVFVFPRRIPIILPEGEELGKLERPLRAQTARGERVALARSDTCPEGTEIEFEIEVLGLIKEDLLREWMDYGKYMALGQWRSGGWGRFTYEMEQL